MIVTNKLGLPKQFEQIAQSHYQYKDKQYSVTTLIMSIRELMLKRRYNDEIEEDCSNLVWALFGQAVHRMLEEYKESNTEIQEGYLIEAVNDYKLSGRFDLYSAETKTVIDYKTCTCWAIIFQDFEKWKKQLQIYAWLLKKAGFEVDNLQVIALIKDWSKAKSKTTANYPQNNIEVINFKFTDNDYKKIEKFIFDKFEEFEEFEEFEDDELPECNDDDRFNDGGSYAVMKNKNIKATKVFKAREWKNAAESSQKYIESLEDDKNTYRVEHRPGIDKKCLDYCSVNNFCNYYKKNHNGDDNNG